MGGATVVSRVVADHPEIFTLRGPASVWTPRYVLSFTAFFAVGIAAYPQLIQRYFAAKSGAVLERSAYLYGDVLIPIDLLPVALGVWSLGFVPNPASPDYVIPLLIEPLTNPVVFGVAMAAGVAALMSTADSQLLTLSSMASRDIYREYIDPDVGDEREVRVAQLFLLVGIALALVFAYARSSGIFQLGSLAVAGFASTVSAISSASTGAGEPQPVRSRRSWPARPRYSPFSSKSFPPGGALDSTTGSSASSSLLSSSSA